MPLVLTTMLVVVSLVFQRRVGAELLAVSVSEGAAQVSVPEVGLMLTVGAAVLLKTVVLAEVVQPLAPVMVTEYSPDVLTGRVFPLPARMPDGPPKV